MDLIDNILEMITKYMSPQSNMLFDGIELTMSLLWPSILIFDETVTFNLLLRYNVSNVNNSDSNSNNRQSQSYEWVNSSTYTDAYIENDLVALTCESILHMLSEIQMSSFSNNSYERNLTQQNRVHCISSNMSKMEYHDLIIINTFDSDCATQTTTTKHLHNNNNCHSHNSMMKLQNIVDVSM